MDARVVFDTWEPTEQCTVRREPTRRCALRSQRSSQEALFFHLALSNYYSHINVHDKVLFIYFLLFLIMPSITERKHRAFNHILKPHTAALISLSIHHCRRHDNDVLRHTTEAYYAVWDAALDWC